MDSVKEFKKCPYCGDKIRLKAVFCKHCHMLLIAPSGQDIKQQTAGNTGKSSRVSFPQRVGQKEIGNNKNIGPGSSLKSAMQNPVDSLPGAGTKQNLIQAQFDKSADTNWQWPDVNTVRIEIEAQNLTKKATLPGGDERTLLSEISFTVKPGEFVAILGGSGSGKTTLLKALMGLWPATSGKVLVNGVNYSEVYGAYKQAIGYVPQDDIVHLELTVEEVFGFSSRLRMPRGTDAHKRQERIEHVLKILELRHRRSSQVKTLSGGERKRVNIGVELITGPGVLFLDEPTAGLDPDLERTLMESMRLMANRGQTIIMATHATANLEICDKIVFLSEDGHLAFYGTPREALSFFNAGEFSEIYKIISMECSSGKWRKIYAQSAFADKYRHQDGKRTALTGLVVGQTAQLSSMMQWYHLSCRYLRVIYRDKKYLALLVVQPLAIAILFSLVFFHAAPIYTDSPFAADDLVFSEEAIARGEVDLIADNIYVEGNRERRMVTVAFSIVLSAIWFGAANAAREIVKELPIYKRERLINIGVASYLLSKVAVLAIVCAFQSMLFIYILKNTLGLPEYGLNAAAFFIVALASVLMGLAVSAFAASANTASTAVPILVIPQLILTGATVPVEDISPEFLQNIFLFAISRWGYELVGGGICDINSLLSFVEPISALEGTFYHHWVILASFCLFFYILATFALVKKDGQFS